MGGKSVWHPHAAVVPLMKPEITIQTLMRALNTLRTEGVVTNLDIVHAKPDFVEKTPVNIGETAVDTYLSGFVSVNAIAAPL